MVHVIVVVKNEPRSIVLLPATPAASFTPYCYCRHLQTDEPPQLLCWLHDGQLCLRMAERSSGHGVSSLHHNLTYLHRSHSLNASFYCKQCSLRNPYNVQEHKRPTSRLAHNNPAPLELVEACSPIRHLLFCPDGLGWCRGLVLAVDGIRHGIVSIGPLGLS